MYNLKKNLSHSNNEIPVGEEHLRNTNEGDMTIISHQCNVATVRRVKTRQRNIPTTIWRQIYIFDLKNSKVHIIILNTGVGRELATR